MTNFIEIPGKPLIQLDEGVDPIISNVIGLFT